MNIGVVCARGGACKVTCSYTAIVEILAIWWQASRVVRVLSQGLRARAQAKLI